jgi:transcriptional regulator with XRE-family HTH domain
MNNPAYIQELPHPDDLAETYPAFSMLGRNMRHFRNQLGLSRGALAGQAGTTEDYLRRIERGEVKSPGLATLCKIARAMGIDVGELVWGVKYE